MYNSLTSVQYSSQRPCIRFSLIPVRGLYMTWESCLCEGVKRLASHFFVLVTQFKYHCYILIPHCQFSTKYYYPIRKLFAKLHLSLAQPISSLPCVCWSLWILYRIYTILQSGHVVLLIGCVLEDLTALVRTVPVVIYLLTEWRRPTHINVD